MSKKMYILTKMSAYGSEQLVEYADDLHQLFVDVLQIFPAPEGREYTDSEIVKKLQERDLWSQDYYLVGEYNSNTKVLEALVTDP